MTKAQELGIPCVAYGGGRNTLPTVEEGKTWLVLQLEFCQSHLAKQIALSIRRYCSERFVFAIFRERHGASRRYFDAKKTGG